MTPVLGHKVTVESPYNHAPNAEEMGGWSIAQRDLVEKAVHTLMRDPFESNMDLRGREIRLLVHSDGLFVTAEVVSGGSDAR